VQTPTKILEEIHSNNAVGEIWAQTNTTSTFFGLFYGAQSVTNACCYVTHYFILDQHSYVTTVRAGNA